jgi:hypothetical protein
MYEVRSGPSDAQIDVWVLFAAGAFKSSSFRSLCNHPIAPIGPRFRRTFMSKMVQKNQLDKGIEDLTFGSLGLRPTLRMLKIHIAGQGF